MIRPSTAADVDAVTRIYAWNVLHGSGTFEIEPPDRLEIERRRADVLAKGLPWLVLESAGTVAGYAYASPFRPRPAYRFCVEDSVYLAPESVGRGFGRLLLAELVARCEAAGARQMLAVIGDSANDGVDRRASRPRLRSRRHAPRRGLEVRSLARRRAHAEGPGSGRRDPGPGGVSSDRRAALQGRRDLARRARRQPRAAPLLPARRARRLGVAASLADAGRRLRLLAPAPVRHRRPARQPARSPARRDARGGHAGGHRLRPHARRALARPLRRARRRHAAGRR